eukprot:g10256.t1
MIETRASAEAAGAGKDGEEKGGEADNRDNEAVKEATTSAFKRTKSAARRNTSGQTAHVRGMNAARAAKKQREAELSVQEKERQRVNGYLDGSLKRKQGEIFTQKEARCILHAFYFHQKNGLSALHAAPRVAAELGVDVKSVKTLAEDFEAGHGVVSTKDGKERGSREDSLLPETQTQIERWIEVKRERGAPVFAADIARWLASTPTGNAGPGEDGATGGQEGGGSAGGTSTPAYDVDRQPMTVSENTVLSWLKKMGYSVQEEKVGHQVTEDRKARIREYIVDLWKAITMANDTTRNHKLVYMDESYVHINQKVHKSIFKDGENYTPHASGKGARAIIVHAITDDGPLVTLDDDGYPIEEGWFKGERAKQAEREKRRTSGRGGRGGRRGARGGRGGGRVGGRGGGRDGGQCGGRGGAGGCGRSASMSSSPQEPVVTPPQLSTGGPASGAEAMKDGRGRKRKAPERLIESMGSGEIETGPGQGGKRRKEGGGGGGSSSTGTSGKRSGASGDDPTAGSSKRPRAAGAVVNAGARGIVVGGGGSTTGTETGKRGRELIEELPEPASAESVVRSGGGGGGKGKGPARKKHKAEKAGAASADEHRLVINEELTAEMIFPAGVKDPNSDYHDNMTNDVFLQWVSKRLKPTFKHLYGEDATMTLILDNAPYHHGMEKDWKSPLLASKDVNLATLRKLKARGIQLDREDGGTADGIMAYRTDGNVFFPLPAESGSFAKAPTGPSTAEVQSATYRILVSKAPEMLETRAEKYFREELPGSMLLYTAPYCPNTQPIELFWGHGKGAVARGFEARRSLLAIVTEIRAAWYGRSKHVRKADCAALVRHALDYVGTTLLPRDGVLEGSIDARKGTMLLDPRTIPSNYRTSKSGRLGRSLDEAEREKKQVQDDEGPRELLTVTAEAPGDCSGADGGAEA